MEQLKQIKLLRKLGVSLEEIRQMQSGAHTVGDGMGRHLISLERERRNLEHSMELCRTLKDREQLLDDLEVDQLLAQMETMEREGTTFLNRQREDTKRGRYVAPAVVTVVTVLLMVGLIALMLYGFALEEDAPPAPLVAVLVAIPGVVIFGVLLAVAQRFREIEKGEADDARQY